MRINLTRLQLLLLTLVSATAHAQLPVDLSQAGLRSPAVASVLEMQRNTPAEQLRAIFTLLDLGEQDIALTLWKDFAAQDLEESTQAALVDEFGAARFLNLVRRESAEGFLGGRRFAESCLQAAAEQNRHPKRLAKLLHDLGDPSAEVQQAARADLAVTGDVGAVACLEALAAAGGRAENAALRTQLLLTLAKMRPGVEPMLLATLAEGRGPFRRDVVELAGYLHLQAAVPWLATLAAGAEPDSAIVSAAHAALAKMGLSSPSTGDARAVVLSEIRRLEAQSQPATADGPWWSFDAEKKTLIAREVSPSEKHLLTIARLASALEQLPNASPSDHRLALIYAYQISELFEQPLPASSRQRVHALSTLELSEMLHNAIETNQLSAAKACAELLGKKFDPLALTSTSGRRSPLAAALMHTNRQLRYAALEAIMTLKPQHSFAGASGVPRALWEFAASAGSAQAIVASSVLRNAHQWAGELRGLGYAATPTATGRQAMRLALEAKRLEFLLVDSDIGRPRLREVIYQLRSASPTARIPIAVLSSLHNLPRAQQMAERDDWLLATPRPHGEGAMQEVLTQLDRLSAERLTADQRSAQAITALGWIADLLETGHPYDELLREANLVSQTLYQPELTKASLRLLAVLGTASSQQLLLDYVSTDSLPIESRREAGGAFAKSVERFDKLLTSAELRRQYDRYNASETADRETQEVLGAVLDILEK